MKKTSTRLLILVILFIFCSAKPEHVCDDCGFTGCIYEAIDKRYDESTDTLEESVYYLCGLRGITDYETIDLIKANYNL